MFACERARIWCLVYLCLLSVRLFAEHVVVNAAADARGLWQVLLQQLLEEAAPVEADPIVTAVRLSCSTRDSKN